MFLTISLAAVGALLLSGFFYEELCRRRDARRFPPLGALVDVGGRRLHLHSKGIEGPTVVIEQGAGGPSLTWLPLQDRIAEFARVCLYDRAGYLWSDAVAGPRSLQDRVTDLHTLLKTGNVPGPYVLVAHSYGGFLVRLFARDYPDSVAGIVLVDTPHEQSYFQREVLATYAKFCFVMRAMALAARVGLPRLVTRLLAKPDPKVAPEDGQRLNAGMVRSEYFAAAADDISSLQRAQKWIVLPETFGTLGDLPLVVITHGQPFPGPFAVLEKGWHEGQQRLAALSSNGELIVAVKSNHMIQNDEPEVVVEAVRRVVATAREKMAARGKDMLARRV